MSADYPEHRSTMDAHANMDTNVSSNTRSKELLKMENQNVSTDEHFKKLFSVSKACKRGRIPQSTRLETNCVLLDRVKSFLPLMAKANENLNTAVEKGDKVDIEDVDELYKGDLIEMNLALFNDEKDSSSEDSESDADTSSISSTANSDVTEDSCKQLVSELEPEKDRTIK